MNWKNLVWLVGIILAVMIVIYWLWPKTEVPNPDATITMRPAEAKDIEARYCKPNEMIYSGCTCLGNNVNGVCKDEK